MQFLEFYDAILTILILTAKHINIVLGLNKFIKPLHAIKYIIYFLYKIDKCLFTMLIKFKLHNVKIKKKKNI